MRSFVMFKPTDRQEELFGAASYLSDSVQKRLRASWADGFARKVYPLLLEAEDGFAGMYPSDKGRPNWSIARMLGLILLQEWFDESDQKALDHLGFDVRWQHALHLRADDAYLSRRSLVKFRSRLVEFDPEMERVRALFDRVTASALADLKLSVAEQRLDSTLITSNIKERGVCDLFRTTLRLALREMAPAEFKRLSGKLQQWYSVEDGPWDKVQLLAEYVLQVVDTFKRDPVVVSRESYQLLVRLLEERCDVGGPEGKRGKRGKGRKKRRTVKARRPRSANNLLQSPFDPDAGIGHKGQGYHVQVAETCNNKGVPELITDYLTHLPGGDFGHAVPSLERLTDRGLRPNVLYADKGYASATSLEKCLELGTRLHAPTTRGRIPMDRIGRDQFGFNEETGEILSCPQGHKPLRHGKRHSSLESAPTPHAYFDRKTCEACPLLKRCCVRRNPQANYYLEILPRLVLRDQRLAEQQTPEFRIPYRIRAGVEATMSELKRSHGLGRLRVRRMPRVNLAVALKMTACNIKRWLTSGRGGGGSSPCPRLRSSPAIRALFATLRCLVRPFRMVA